MNDLSWAATVRLVHERADYCCEYCQTCQQIMAQAMHVEHIDPHGSDNPDNLCLACPTCNMSKARATEALYPETDETIRLFNPRIDNWADHFIWTEGGRRILGLTPIGRATVVRLKMNMARVVHARALWIKAGVHPPFGEG